VTESIDGSDALKMPDKENMTVIDRLDEVDMSENPELKPLKEAVQRARQRMEEATGIREALEAEAQEVAQLAVNAESHYKDILKQYEDAQTQLEQMVERNESLAKVVETIQQQLTDDTALSSQKEEDPLVYASQDDTSSSDLMEDVAEGDSVGTSLEDLLWQ